MNFNLIEFIIAIFDFSVGDYLRIVWDNAPWVEPLFDLISALIIGTIVLLLVFVLGWTERKVLARMQDRIGPNRVGGRYGQMQMVADVVKMMTKEVIIPNGADKPAYLAAPAVALATSVLLFAVMPFAPTVIGVDLNVGVFYVLAISSISVVALLLAGWGSNNKYALLGAFRAVAQLVSYEIPMILSILIPIILARSMSTVALVEAQRIPFIIFAPITALIFFISALAETGRSPFDLLEAESEIVAGFHTEYTGMYFGLFMAAEYIAILFMCAMFVTAFLGGYRFFGIEDIVVGDGFALGRGLAIIVLVVKISIIFFVFMWIRGTLPRFRIDQMLNFNWKFMVPLTIVLLFTVALLDKIIMKYIPGITADGWLRALIHFGSNILIGIGTLEILRSRGRKERAAVEAEMADEDEHDDHAHDHHAVPAH